MKKNIFLTIILLTASGLSAASQDSFSNPLQTMSFVTPTMPDSTSAVPVISSQNMPMPIIPSAPVALPASAMDTMNATAQTNAAIHKPNPAITQGAQNVLKQANTVVTTTAGHVTTQAKALATQTKNTAQTIIQQVKALKTSADTNGISDHVQKIAEHFQNAYQFAQTPAVKNALIDYGAGQQQIAEAGGLTTTAGQSIHTSFQKHMEQQHGPTIQQAIQHMQNIKATINGFLTEEMFAAAFSANNNQGQAALNVLDGLNVILSPIADYINSGQARAMIDQISAAIDNSK